MATGWATARAAIKQDKWLAGGGNGRGQGQKTARFRIAAPSKARILENECALNLHLAISRRLPL